MKICDNREREILNEEYSNYSHYDRDDEYPSW